MTLQVKETKKKCEAKIFPTLAEKQIYNDRILKFFFLFEMKNLFRVCKDQDINEKRLDLQSGCHLSFKMSM